jgi:hypothetical protein
MDSANTPAIDTVDPTALLQERDEMNRRNIVKVPELIDELIVTLAAIYPDLYESDFTNPEGEPLSEAKLITVVLQDEVREEPSRMRRIFEWFGLRKVRRLLHAEQSEQIACWEVTWVNMHGTGPFVTLYISVADGTAYTLQTAHKKARVLERTLLERCNYVEAEALLKRAKDRHERILSNRKHREVMAAFAAEEERREAERLKEASERAAALDDVRERLGMSESAATTVEAVDMPS